MCWVAGSQNKYHVCITRGCNDEHFRVVVLIHSMSTSFKNQGFAESRTIASPFGYIPFTSSDRVDTPWTCPFNKAHFISRHTTRAVLFEVVIFLRDIRVSLQVEPNDIHPDTWWPRFFGRLVPWNKKGQPMKHMKLGGLKAKNWTVKQKFLDSWKLTSKQWNPTKWLRKMNFLLEITLGFR